jgi:hypothetical protein
MNKTMNKNNDTLFVFLFFTLGIIFLPLSVPTTIMINAQPPSDSISGGTTSSSVERGENNTKNPKVKDNIDKQQMAICVVGARGPCNGDSNFDGREDRTGQCILSNGCSSSNSSNRTVQNKSTNTTSANSTSNSPIMVSGLMLK